MKTLTIATRKSPLALAQTTLVAERLAVATGADIRLLKLVTTGDRQTGWSLEKEGGKGLFTKELEAALLAGEADVAVHSAKDLPGAMPAGLVVAGYLPRADPRDVLVVRQGVVEPETVATGSPRRRLQLAMRFPDVSFTEIRGNVDTRLRKIGQDAVADATVLAAAGLARLGIATWPGVEFRPLGFDLMVPAVGQAAIALQCRVGEESLLSKICDEETALAVTMERAFQARMGGGCQTSLGVHCHRDTLHFFHPEVGLRSFPMNENDRKAPEIFSSNLLKYMGL